MTAKSPTATTPHTCSHTTRPANLHQHASISTLPSFKYGQRGAFLPESNTILLNKRLVTQFLESQKESDIRILEVLAHEEVHAELSQSLPGAIATQAMLDLKHLLTELGTAPTATPLPTPFDRKLDGSMVERCMEVALSFKDDSEQMQEMVACAASQYGLVQLDFVKDSEARERHKTFVKFGQFNPQQYSTLLKLLQEHGRQTMMDVTQLATVGIGADECAQILCTRGHWVALKSLRAAGERKDPAWSIDQTHIYREYATAYLEAIRPRLEALGEVGCTWVLPLIEDPQHHISIPPMITPGLAYFDADGIHEMGRELDALARRVAQRLHEREASETVPTPRLLKARLLDSHTDREALHQPTSAGNARFSARREAQSARWMESIRQQASVTGTVICPYAHRSVPCGRCKSLDTLRHNLA